MAPGGDPKLFGREDHSRGGHLRHALDFGLDLRRAVGAVQSLQKIDPGFQPILRNHNRFLVGGCRFRRLAVLPVVMPSPDAVAMVMANEIRMAVLMAVFVLVAVFVVVAVLMFMHMFFLLLEFVLDFPEQIAYNLSVTEHFVLYLL